MPDDSNGSTFDYNSMQASLGLIPPFATQAPPLVYPGQVSAQMAQGGAGAAMMSMGFQTHQMPGLTTGPGLMQGPGGFVMPMQPGAAFNPYAPGGGSPSGYGMPSIYSRTPASPPPYFSGPQGSPIPFLSPPPPPSMFQTPYMGQMEQLQGTRDRMFSGSMAGAGMASRATADLLAGAAGFMAGGAIGGAIGVGASEYLGVGRGAQNFMMNQVMAPAINQRGYAGGIEELSRRFVSGGPEVGAMGQGFSHAAAANTARMLSEMSTSRSFQSETFGRFNTNDVMKMTQLGADNHLMEGVQTGSGMTTRVRDIAKSLNAFMELANEPDITRAIQTMGQMRSSGLNLSETLQAVQHGRTFARMAGTSFEQMAAIGGAQGSQTFGSMGLSQGLGFQTGMANYGMAQAMQNAGVHSPQMMNLLGGAQGYANQNDMFSAGMLRLPMLAPGLMSGSGGLSTGAMENFLGGRSNLFGITGQAAGALGGMTGRYGAEGLGLAVSMQPMMQDSIGRILQAQGPFAQRQMEDSQIQQMARQMNMRGSSGYVTAARALGMSDTQAVARAQELSSPAFFDRQRRQIEVNRRERRTEELRAAEADRPGVMDTLSLHSETVAGARRGLQGLSGMFDDAYHALAGGGGFDGYRASSDVERREMSGFYRGGGFNRAFQDVSRAARRSPTDGSAMDRHNLDVQLMEAQGYVGIAGHLGAAFGGVSDEERSRLVRQYQQAGGAAQTILSGGGPGRERAIRRMGQTFGTGAGGQQAMGEFGERMAGLFTTQNAIGNMAANAAVRGAPMAAGMLMGGAGGMAMGMIDPGNMFQGAGTTFDQMRRAYVQTMSGHGQTAEQAGRTFDQNPNLLMQQSGGLIFNMMNREQRSNLRDAIARGQGMRGTGGSMVGEAQAMQRRGFSQLVGGGAETDEHLRSGANAFMQGVGEGVGHDDRTREQSRQYLAAREMLETTLTDASAGPEAQNRARRMITQMRTEARRRGATDQELDQMETRVRRFGESAAGRNAGANRDTRDAARAFVREHGGSSGGRIMDALREGMGSVRGGAAVEDFTRGLEVLGRGNSVLGRAFQGVNAGQMTSDDFRGRITDITQDQLREMTRETGGADTARAIRRFQQTGDASALSRVQEMIAKRGEVATQAHNAFTHRGVLTQISDIFHGRGEQDYINRATERGTRADEEADRQLAGVDAAESEARGSGMGRAGDAILEASRNLNEAAARFSGAASNGSIEDILGRNNQ